MGYRKIALILISFLLLCGCKNENDQIGGDGTGQTGDGQASVYAYSDMTVIDMSDGGSLVYRTEKDEMIVGAAGSADTLFVLTYCDAASAGNDQTEHMPFTLNAVNRKSGISGTVSGENAFITAGFELELAGSITSAEQEMNVFPALRTAKEVDVFPASISGELLGYYKGKLYMIYYLYEENEGVRNLCAYCFEQQPDGSFAKSQDTLCTTMMDLYNQGYLYCGDARDLFTGLNAYDRLLVWKQEEAKVCAVAVDGSILWERQIDPRIINIKGTDGRLLFGVGRAEDEDGWYYFIYDLEGTFADGSDVKEGTYGWSDGSYLDMRDGYFYFYRYNKVAFHQNQYFFYRCNLYDADGSEELLFETVDITGQPYQREGNNGVAGFTVEGDACYYMDFDGENLWWFSCGLSDEAHGLTRLDVVDEYHGIFDMGKVTYATDNYQCDNCGELIYDYYIEGIRLYGDDPVIDRINGTLTDEMDRILELMEDRLRTYQTTGTAGEHLCGSYTNRTTFEEEVNGVTRYRFNKDGQDWDLICLEADYSGYDYSGGAHGYPSRAHFLFDLSDGAEISMADVIGVSEEEFRALAAEYTVADYLGENGVLYFETEEDALYETVYKDVGFDFQMYLGADGVVVEYFPYYLGPYASGVIEVTVPYEEIGLKLVEIYGVNE